MRRLQESNPDQILINDRECFQQCVPKNKPKFKSVLSASWSCTV